MKTSKKKKLVSQDRKTRDDYKLKLKKFSRKVV